MLYTVMVQGRGNPLPAEVGEFSLGGAIKCAEKLHAKNAGEICIVSSSGRKYLY